MSVIREVDLVALVGELAHRGKTRTEADVQSGIQTLLLYGGLNLEDPEVKLETPAPGRRRVDIETGRTVIECKKDLSVGNVRAEAVDQLAGYVRDRTAELGQRYAGILTDGQEWAVYHLNQATGELHKVAADISIKPSEPDVERLLVWLEGVMSTAEALEPTPIEIRRRLGSDAPGFELDLAELRDIWEQCKTDPEVRQKRELWSRLLAAAFGTNFADEDALFIEHTYLVLTAEVIAHAVLGFDLGAGALTAKDLVSGEEFRKASIAGVVEDDFFDWPVSIPQGEAFVDGLARRLARFAWTAVEHDVLKVLYESVIDPETRHSLGEYYTPDWLAQIIVNDVVDAPLEQRALDPACGSGTFLFWAVRAYVEAAEAAGQDNKQVINGVVSHVFGIDLHPVAVTLARVTYLLAIGTNRLGDRDPFGVPVYLGDSIQLNEKTSVLSNAGLTVHTTDGLELFAQELNFPESLVADAGRFDRLVTVLAEKAAKRLKNSKPAAIDQIMTNHSVTQQSDRDMVAASYGVLCHLYDNHRDHIWGYYVRNIARPLEFTRAAHRVDRLIGNPPWLRYNAMTKQTQEHFRRLTKDRNLQAPPQVTTSQDLSALFVARAVELYLRPSGRFGFVMPAATLSRLQYRGFRAANFSSKTASVHVAFDDPWELSEVLPQPFPVPASVVFGSRVDAMALVAMPTSATWHQAKGVPKYGSWDDVKSLFRSEPREVVVAGQAFNSPYADLVLQGSNLVPRVLLAVRESGETVLGVPGNQITVESARLGGEKPPWRDLDSLNGPVEKDFVIPMLLGDSLLPFTLRGDVSAIVPWNGKKVLSGDDQDIDAFPGLAAWWRKAEGMFNRHKSDTTAITLKQQIDHLGKLRAQFPLAEHRLAYTGRGSIVTAARISNPDAVVDHALYWVGFDSEEEALYVVGVINTEAMNKRIQTALSKGLFGSRNIHRAPFLVPWPQFVADDDLHCNIVQAVRDAEVVAASVPDAQTAGIGHARKLVRKALAEDGVGGRLESHVEQLLVQAGADKAIADAPSRSPSVN